MPPRGRPTLVVLPPVASSSVASLSSTSSCCAAAARRSLALAASSRRNSALLAAYFGPSSLSSSPRARTTLLTPTPIICRQVGVPTKQSRDIPTRLSYKGEVYFVWYPPPTLILRTYIDTYSRHECQGHPEKSGARDPLAGWLTRASVARSTTPTPTSRRRPSCRQMRARRRGPHVLRS